MMKIRKKVDELTLKDLAEYPVWEFALDEEGEENQDETTVRPYKYKGILDPSLSMFIIQAMFELADGTRQQGYLTPDRSKSDLGFVQPVIIASEGRLIFWHGVLRPDDTDLSQFYGLLGKTSALQVFPIKFWSNVALKIGPMNGEIPGFMVMADILGEKIDVIK
ncbi:MAG: hypothetical protein H7X92_13810 [Chitinophagales bacterium]|nr:hypothetical protein [Hyphomicrobiales bacterium]